MWNRGCFVEPGCDFGAFVGGVVVADQVDLKALGNLLVDGAQELQELGVPVPGQAVADHLAGQHVQRGEQGGGAVALVVVGHRRCPAPDHRQ